MPYVMVPVPEEHVEEVMQFILRAVARAAIEPWDEASISELFAEIDEPSRSLLAFVARAAGANGDLPDDEAARLLQLSVREAVAIQRELNERARDLNRPALITRRATVETLPNGRTTEKQVFAMDAEVAVLVRDAERAELAADGPPVPGPS